MAGASKRRRSASRTANKRARTAMRYPLSKSKCEATFSRTFNVGNWSFSTLTTAGFYRVIAPAFGDMPSVAEYQALFDVFKVTGVKITLVPRFGEVQLPAASTGALTAYNSQFNITVGLDRNSATAPTGTYGVSSFNDMCEKCDNVKTYKFDRPITYFYKPNVRSSTVASTSLGPCPWISTDQVNDNQLGSRVYIHDNNFAANASIVPSIDLIYTFYFKCKGSR